MKKALIFIVLYFLLSGLCCQDTFDHNLYIKQFNNKKGVFDDIVVFLLANSEFHEQYSVHYYDEHLIKDDRFVSPVKDSLAVFFSFGLFKKIDHHASGEIEFLIDFRTDDFWLTETSIKFLYYPEKFIPESYIRPGKQIKMAEHWWYIESVDAQY